MSQGTTWPILGILLLIGVSTGVAALLRWSRCIAWPIVGGVAAGILLGPGVLGRMAPEFHQRVFEGGSVQQAMRELISRQGAEELIELRLSPQPDDLDRLKQRQQSERADAQRSLDEARWNDQAPIRVVALFVVGLTLLASGLKAVRRGDLRQGIIAPLSIGAWAAVLPGAITYVAATMLWEVTSAQAALIAAAVAIGPWVLTQVDRQAADNAEFGGARMVQTAGRIASLLAVIAALYGFIAVCGWGSGWVLLAFAALPVGWIIGEFCSSKLQDQVGNPIGVPFESKSQLDHACEFALLPMLAALASIKIDLLRDFSIWPLLLIILLSGDGRWFGAIIGALLPGGRKPLRTMRLVLGSMAAGPTQLAVVALGTHLWAIPTAMALPLVFGALYLELTTPSRRFFSQSLSESEEDLEQSA